MYGGMTILGKENREEDYPIRVRLVCEGGSGRVEETMVGEEGDW